MEYGHLGMNNEINILRELAKKYIEITSLPIQNERRMNWRRLNSLKPNKPLILVRGYAFNEVLSLNGGLKCEDPVYRQCEEYFRDMIFRNKIGDDHIYESYYMVTLVYLTPDDMYWGEGGGSYQVWEKTYKNGFSSV